MMKIVVWLCILLAVVAPLALTSSPARALPFWDCCRLGSPGCCFFVLIELWWEGQIDFPGPGGA
jgi:hypothetical protein